ncbi:hypothetical protein [Flavobacterium sp. FlaQc-50]|jgi:plasmid maintenance system antidote protein VapI|uniref:hypothetical protein n=1 Tax=unclassified Flavobacterium TaxID=196869 RepID=UPI0037583B3F
MEQLKVITAKELANSMGVHVNTAKSFIKDIKQEYAITTVLLCHVNSYFKVNAK